MCGADHSTLILIQEEHHGYPRHYYNMTHQGLSNLFPGIDVLGVEVYEELRPITALCWMIASWAAGLPRPVMSKFLNMRLGEIMELPYDEICRGPKAWLPRIEANPLDSGAVLKAKVRGALLPYRVTDRLRRARRAA